LVAAPGRDYWQSILVGPVLRLCELLLMGVSARRGRGNVEATCSRSAQNQGSGGATAPGVVHPAKSALGQKRNSCAGFPFQGREIIHRNAVRSAAAAARGARTMLARLKAHNIINGGQGEAGPVIAADAVATPKISTGT